MWLALILVASQHFTVMLDSEEDCDVMYNKNMIYWAKTGQEGQIVCMEVRDI